jgi:transposase
MTDQPSPESEGPASNAPPFDALASLRSALQQRDEAKAELESARRRYNDAVEKIHRFTASLVGEHKQAMYEFRQLAKDTPAEHRPTRRGRPPVKRQTHKEFVISLLERRESMTTAEIRDAWRQSGRAGRVDNVLNQLRRMGLVGTRNGHNRLLLVDDDDEA